MDDDEIVREFLVESAENLDQLDRDLVELEQRPGDRELLSSIFRTIHTIKGTSGFLAFARLEELTHVGENLLSRLRDGHLAMTPPIADALLHMVDTVRMLLADIERTGTDCSSSVEGAIDVDPVVRRIRACLDDSTCLEDSTGPAPAAPSVSAQLTAVGAGASVQAAGSLDDLVAGSPGVPASTINDQAVPDAQPVTFPATRLTGVTEPAAHLEHAGQPDDGHPDAGHPDGGHPDDGAQPRRSSAAESTVRVDVSLLDTLVDLVGELVLTRNQILQQADSVVDVELLRASQRLNLVASELQENVLKTRMQPIGNLWAKLPRVVRDLGAQLGRAVQLQMDGHDTELDRSLLEAIKDPLTHLVRNAVDHGIEAPEQRAAAGKNPEGVLSLRAYHESGQVVVEICDDGRGIDPIAVGRAAVARGIIDQDALARMDPRGITDLVFRPGFSTASAVTNVSGRGVGMDVVRTNIERIGGTVDLTSRPGFGCTVRVRIPLTLAIIPALVVSEGDERYAIPQANLVELVRLEGADLRNIETLAGAPVLRLRGHLLPLVSMADALGSSADSARTGAAGHVVDSETVLTVVVVQADDLRFGLSVAQVHDTQEIVVKPLGRQLKGLALYAGATIMGDGRVALIIDVAGLAHASRISASAPRTIAPVPAEADPEDSVSLLVLDVGGDRRAAMPLDQVARLEEFQHETVERCGSAEVVQYRDGILPLVRLAGAIGVPAGTPGDLLSVVVHGEGAARVGIVVDRVVDVVTGSARPNPVGRRSGVLGSAVVAERVTDLVDLDAVVALAGAGT